MTTTPAAGPVLVDRHQLAALLGVHADRLSEYRHAGMPVVEAAAARVGQGRARNVYDAIACAQWVRRHRPGVLDAGQERAELDRARRGEIELRVKVRRGELLERLEVDRVWSGHVAAVRTKLLAWPMTLADRLHRTATLGSVAEVEAVLVEAVRDVLSELANGDGPRRRRRPPGGHVSGKAQGIRSESRSRAIREG